MNDFRELFISVLPDLRRYAVQLTQNEAEVDDLFQETALKLLSKANQFQEGTNYKAWAFTIMRNNFINECRKTSLRHRVNAGLKRPEGFGDGGTDTVRNGGLEEVEYKELCALVAELPAQQRVPFQMKLEGYRYREIAEQLSVSVNALKSRVFYARQALRRRYAIEFKMP